MSGEIEIKVQEKNLGIYILVRNVRTDYKADCKFFKKGNTFSFWLIWFSVSCLEYSPNDIGEWVSQVSCYGSKTDM